MPRELISNRKFHWMSLCFKCCADNCFKLKLPLTLIDFLKKCSECERLFSPNIEGGLKGAQNVGHENIFLKYDKILNEVVWM